MRFDPPVDRFGDAVEHAAGVERIQKACRYLFGVLRDVRSLELGMSATRRGLLSDLSPSTTVSFEVRRGPVTFHATSWAVGGPDAAHREDTLDARPEARGRAHRLIHAPHAYDVRAAEHHEVAPAAWCAERFC